MAASERQNSAIAGQSGGIIHHFVFLFLLKEKYAVSEDFSVFLQQQLLRICFVCCEKSPIISYDPAANSALVVALLLFCA